MKKGNMILIAATLLSTSATAGNQPSMVKPNAKGCGEFYTLIEGVCVHALAMTPTDTLKRDIEKFKRTGIAPKRGDSKKETAGMSREQARCNKYKERLKKYETEGVLGVDAATNKIIKMEGEAAEMVIQGARDNVEIFCEGV